VVGVVQLRPGASAGAGELREFCAAALARFKAPRSIAFVETIGRHPSGKPDYRWARDAAASAVDASSEQV
jgi:fatty-acyl-CoA synthase